MTKLIEQQAAAPPPVSYPPSPHPSQYFMPPYGAPHPYMYPPAGYMPPYAGIGPVQGSLFPPPPLAGVPAGVPAGPWMAPGGGGVRPVNPAPSSEAYDLAYLGSDNEEYVIEPDGADEGAGWPHSAVPLPKQPPMFTPAGLPMPGPGFFAMPAVGADAVLQQGSVGPDRGPGGVRGGGAGRVEGEEGAGEAERAAVAGDYRVQFPANTHDMLVSSTPQHTATVAHASLFAALDAVTPLGTPAAAQRPDDGDGDGDGDGSYEAAVDRSHDAVDRSYPEPEFTPLVNLPERTDLVTGEEGASVLLEVERVRLYRFADGQWKERGVGPLRLLLAPDSQRGARVLMRREQVHKVCANHRVRADHVVAFKDDADADCRVLLWMALDFSDADQPNVEQFSCKFRSRELAAQFKAAFEDARRYAVVPPGGAGEKLDEEKVEEEEEGGDAAEKGCEDGAEKTAEEASGGSLAEMFRATAGSWDCDVCLVRNEGAATACAACATPRPGCDPPAPTPKVTPAEVTAGPSGGLIFPGMTASSTFSFGTASFGSSGVPVQPAPFGSTTQTSGDAAFGNASKEPEPVFGGVAKQPGAVFGGIAKQPDTSFGAIAKQPTSVFGGIAKQPGATFGNAAKEPQPVFGGIAKQPDTSFGAIAKQPNSVFGGIAKQPGTTSGDAAKEPEPVFGGIAKQPGATFGGAAKEPQPVFGGIAKQPDTNFGAIAKQPNSVFGGIAKQPGTTSGDAAKEPEPVFGGIAKQPDTSFGAIAKQPNSVFGGIAKQPGATFGDAAKEPEPVFGGIAKQPDTSFGAIAKQPNSVFGGIAKQPGATFGDAAKEPEPVFGGIAKQPDTSFGAIAKQPNSVFGGIAKQPGATFGAIAKQPDTPSGSIVKKPDATFGAAVKQADSPFGASVFGVGTTQASSVFGGVTTQPPAVAAAAAFGAVTKQGDASQQSGEKNKFGVGSVFSAAAAASSAAVTAMHGESSESASSATGGTTLGGFSFVGAPVVTPAPPAEREEKEEEAGEGKTAGPFSSFTFGAVSGETTFASLAAAAGEQPVAFTSDKLDGGGGFTGAKLFQHSPPAADGDHADDEFVPSGDFEAVISLPELTDLVTGEEDEERLFEARARLYRLDAASKTWKERGVGPLRLLRHVATGRCRVVMRREQVLKLCANHRVTPAMALQPLETSDRAWCWSAHDHADDADGGAIEHLAAKFKTPEIAAQFKAAFELCQVEQEAAGQEGEGEGTPQKEVAAAAATAATPQETPATSLSDLFKAKAGEWQCDTCLVRNASGVVQCAACDTLRPGADPPPPAVSKPPASAVTFGSGGGFQFGGTSAGKAGFSFGSSFGSFGKPAADVPTSAAVAGVSSGFAFGKPAATVTSTVVTAMTATPAVASTPAFSFNEMASSGAAGFAFTPTKPFVFASSGAAAAAAASLSPTAGVFTFGNADMKHAATPPRTGAPDGTPASPELYENVDGDDSHIEFQPIVQLPAQVAVVTGEEEEEVLWEARARLYRFTAAEWKERGVGGVRLLRHSATGRCRVVMRRDQVHKICLNHALSPDLTLLPMPGCQDRAWLWHAADFADAAPDAPPVYQQFALRFKTKELAADFKDVFDSAKLSREDESPGSILVSLLSGADQQGTSDGVETIVCSCL